MNKLMQVFCASLLLIVMVGMIASDLNLLNDNFGEEQTELSENPTPDSEPEDSKEESKEESKFDDLLYISNHTASVAFNSEFRNHSAEIVAESHVLEIPYPPPEC